MGFGKCRLQRIKKDAGTIFSPAMYLVLFLLVTQLLLIFVEYRRVSWVSTYVTNGMTDALLGACTLNEEELLSYGKRDDIEIRYPAEKYQMFKKILTEELGLNGDMKVGSNTIPLLKGAVEVTDFRIYSVHQNGVTYYDFDGAGGYTTKTLDQTNGVLTLENGVLVEDTAMMAEIAFTVDFLGFPMKVKKYHLVDVARN